MLNVIEGSRTRERPAKRWSDDIADWCMVAHSQKWFRQTWIRTTGLDDSHGPWVRGWRHRPRPIWTTFSSEFVVCHHQADDGPVCCNPQPTSYHLTSCWNINLRISNINDSILVLMWALQCMKCDQFLVCFHFHPGCSTVSTPISKWDQSWLDSY